MSQNPESEAEITISNLFYEELQANESTPVSPSVSVEHYVEYRLAAAVLAAAYRKRVIWDIDVQFYAKRLGGGVKVSKEKEGALKTRYPPIFCDPRKAFCEPLVVVDRKGRILVWYLPGILSVERNNEIFQAVSLLRDELTESISKGGSWRTSSESFHDLESAGCINLSPAWFQQAHDSFTSQLELSRHLKRPGNGRKWLHEMKSTFELLNGISNVIHPDQHRIGKDAMEKLRGDKSIIKEGVCGEEVMDTWRSVFSAIAIVLNRETLTHRDMQSPATGLDVMLTVGPYSEAWMVLEGLGIDLLYRSGTIVALSGSLIPHAVECREVGRLCLSFYMRSAVHEALGLDFIEYTVHGA